MALKDSVLNIVIKAKDQAATTLGKLRDRLKRTDKDTNTLAGSMKRLATTIAGLAGAYLSINALKNAFTGILSTGADFEKFRAQLDQVMGSIEGGERATEWVKDFTTRTPFELGQVTEGFIKLKSFGLDPMDGTYEALANQAAALGGDQETLNGIILATGQAWAKQKLQGEEILQLVERGVPVWDLLAKSTGKSVTELQELSSAGKLGREEIAGLVREIGKASDGALQAQMGTLNGLVSNVRDQWTQFTATIADSGLQEYVKGLLSDLLEQFNRLREDGTLARWAKQISDAFISLGNTIREFTTRTVGDIDTFGDRASEALSTFATATKGALAGARLLANGIGAAFNAAVIGVAAGLGSLSDSFAAFLEKTGADEMARSFRAVADTADATAAEYSNRLRANNENIKESFGDLADTMISEGKRGAEGAAQEQAKAAKLTGDALREAVDEAEAQTERLQAQLDGINADAATAAAETQRLWAEVYSSTGEAKAKALADLNAAISEENRLRREAATAAQELNRQTAESEQLVADLAKEKATEQAKAAQAARESLKGLGVDAGAAFESINASAKTSIDSLTSIADEIGKIEGTSQEAAAAFDQGITAALENVATAEEFDLIDKRVRELFREDKIDSTALASALDLIREKQREVNEQSMGDSIDEAGSKAEEAKGKVDQLADATKQAAEQAEEARDKFRTAWGAAFSQAISNARESVTALSTAARNLFETKIGGNAFVTESISAAEALEQTRQRVDELASSRRRLMSNSFAAWFTDTALAAAEVKQEFYEQAVALDSLNERIESGSFSMDQLARISSTAANQFDLLDDQRLAGLQSAIDAARNRLDSLNSSAENTLTNLQRRLADLRGDTEEAQRLEYEAERKRLEQEREAAEQAGADQAAADYARALQQLDQINKLEQQKNREAEQERQAQAEERERQAQAQAREEQQARQQASTTTNRQDSQASRATQTIVLQTPQGGTTEVQTADPDGLLGILEQTGLRSA